MPCTLIFHMRTHLRSKNSTSVVIETKKGPVFPGSNVAGIIVNTSSSEVQLSMNPRGVDISWVGTMGDPSYGRPWSPGRKQKGVDAQLSLV